MPMLENNLFFGKNPDQGGPLKIFAKPFQTEQVLLLHLWNSKYEKINAEFINMSLFC